jgi:Haloacid dehalogenase-like hydrolase
MAVDAVIFDVSDTVVDFQTGIAAQGIPEALDRLRRAGIVVLAASNEPRTRVEHALTRAGILDLFHHIVTSQDVGAKKGSLKWVSEFRRRTGLGTNQFLYVGDSKHDMITATSGPMVFAQAAWTGQTSDYGLVAPTPGWVPAVVEHCFRKQHRWYWALTTTDARGRTVRASALLDTKGAGNPALQHQLLQVLKDDTDSPVGPMMLSDFVMLHLLGSLYEKNLFTQADIWTTYPSHAGQANAVMGRFLDVAAKLFKNTYRDDLLVRHTVANRSKDAWSSGKSLAALTNQLESMRLGESYYGKLTGKRILLLDNFLTRGYTTEVGRNLLLAGGAADVSVCCVAKYGQVGGLRMHVLTPPPGLWDPFGKELWSASPPADQWTDQEVSPTLVDRDALSEFAESYARMQQERW